MTNSGEVELLTAAEEEQLALAMEAGVLAQEALDGGTAVAATTAELRALVREGEAARVRFVAANFGLARMVTRQLVTRSGVPEADVYQEACLGLLLAVRRFDCRRGFRFATYALFWIRAAAGAATAGALGESALSTNQASHLRVVRGVEADLTQSLGRAATAQDVATALGRSPHWVEELLTWGPPRSLSGVGPELAVGSGPGRREREDATARMLLAQLGGQSRQVLELRLGFTTGEPVGYAAIGRRLQIPVGRVRRLEQVALDQLRDVCPYDLAEGW